MSERAGLSLFAVAAPGLEEVVAEEVEGLGVEARREAGGVAWEGDLASLYAANLHLRVASRVLVRVACFRARSFIELERHARRIDFSPYLDPARGVRLRVASRKSRLYHEGAIAERFARWIAEDAGIGGVAAALKGEEDEQEGDDPLLLIRFSRDECVISADSSGDLLHRRGYRRAVAKAPLRETLAAALLAAAGWSPDVPLLDPFCGSGTVPIEGALLARRIPPGLASADRAPRRFAFERWRGFDPALWEDTVAKARACIRESATVPIVGSDRDAGAIAAARDNARRAGVDADIRFEVRPLSTIDPPAGPGVLVTNPPYGVRVGEAAPLRDLYAALGRTARQRLPGWTIAFLSADPALDRQTELGLEERLRTVNGGIAVSLRVGRPRGPMLPDR